MDRADIRSKLRELLAVVSEDLVEREDIGEESRIQEDLGLDSLQIAELLFEIDEAFDIKIGDDEARTLRTVADAIDMIQNKLKGPTGGAE